jgi:hypothetical protein
VLLWHVLGPCLARGVGVDTVALERRPAAGKQPVGCGGPIAGQRVQHGLIMIAEQVHHGHARDRGVGQQPPQHSGRVCATIDVVANMQQHRLIHRTTRQILGDDLMQVGELCVAAMDIADRIKTATWRQAGGGSGQRDHRSGRNRRTRRRWQPHRHLRICYAVSGSSNSMLSSRSAAVCGWRVRPARRSSADNSSTRSPACITPMRAHRCATTARL